MSMYFYVKILIFSCINNTWFLEELGRCQFGRVHEYGNSLADQLPLILMLRSDF